MKLVKAITSDQLESATRDGWALTDEPHIEKRFVEDKRYVEPRSDQETGRFINGFWRHDVQFGDVLVFIVWKDAEIASREAVLQHQIADLKERVRALETVEHSVAKLVENNDKLKRDQDILEAKVTKARDEAVSKNSLIAAQNRKLEGDHAKIRAAIGELKMKEILGES